MDLGGVGAGDDLPAAFRLFAVGVNESTKGPTLFDAAAAESVMRAFAAGGVDLTIDLEHDSLSEAARAARSDAGDARGWFSLEVRDGELWAVNVTWTPDGERRLRERTQRYVSPAFRVDDEDRVIEVVNVALCSMPATLGAVPLVASRGIPANTETRTMDPTKIKEAVEALKAGDGEAALAVLESLIVEAAGGDDAAEEPSADAEPAPDALADTPD
ncbi:MAG: phage protease, partial [Candidatus Neomarinimicrobiota bacterium]